MTINGYINNGNYYEGDRQGNDLVVPARPSPLHSWNSGSSAWDLNLVTAKEQAKIEIDNKAGEIREKYITVVSGQEATYIEKAKDAERFISDGVPSITDGLVYPFTWAEGIAMVVTPLEAANAIISTKDSWLQIAANIEQERRGGKINIDLAVDEISINNAKLSAISALENL